MQRRQQADDVESSGEGPSQWMQRCAAMVLLAVRLQGEVPGGMGKSRPETSALSRDCPPFLLTASRLQQPDRLRHSTAGRRAGSLR
jgi:hypothetical protein